ncbi:MAG: hypothetical protein K9G70_09155 [Prolixibacteraceae bacterium]|nr:hypothetical protein [Prolixibacteraceae bacterium]
MPVNFFIYGCKSTTSKSKFGLCDDQHNEKKPAYIDENIVHKWIAEVENRNMISVDFHAIDNCIEILKLNGGMEKRCDCMLHYNNSLIFAELKDRGYRGWIARGSSQISKTIKIFKENHDINYFDKVEAYICNKQRPLAILGINTTAQKFKDETGLTLNINRKIKIR